MRVTAAIQPGAGSAALRAAPNAALAPATARKPRRLSSTRSSRFATGRLLQLDEDPVRIAPADVLGRMRHAVAPRDLVGMALAQCVTAVGQREPDREVLEEHRDVGGMSVHLLGCTAREAE